MVVETMKKEHLSIYAAMQEFGINDHKIIERWERICLEEGPEGLSVERRGLWYSTLQWRPQAFLKPAT